MYLTCLIREVLFGELGLGREHLAELRAHCCVFGTYVRNQWVTVKQESSPGEQWVASYYLLLETSTGPFQAAWRCVEAPESRAEYRR